MSWKKLTMFIHPDTNEIDYAIGIGSSYPRDVLDSKPKEFIEIGAVRELEEKLRVAEETMIKMNGMKMSEGCYEILQSGLKKIRDEG